MPGGSKKPGGRRADQQGPLRRVADKNRAKILKTQEVCGICGQRVDKSLKWPNPMSACVDHIIPVDKGGHPADISNMQLAHFWCNRQKSNKLTGPQIAGAAGATGSVEDRSLPLATDWKKWKSC